MGQKEIAIWLKGISIFIGIMGLVFFLWLMPKFAGDLRIMYEEVAFLYWPGMIYGWVIGIGCFAVLYQFWKVCNEIGKDNSFSKENAKSFKNISRITLILSVIWFAGLVYLVVNKWMGPPFMLIMIFAILISIIISILAATLSHLILKAYEMKQENELTI